MTRLPRIAALALLGTAFAATAFAQTPYAVGSGEHTEVLGRGEATNVVGGALVRVIGSGEGATTEVIEAPVSQRGAVARVTGSGENQTVTYEQAPTATARLADATRG